MKTFIYPELEMPFLQGLVAKAERHFLFREFSNSSIMANKTYSELLKSPLWQKKRLQILNRDKFTCKLCGDTETTLNVHHIEYSQGKPWEIENSKLITTCEHCHCELENLKKYGHNFNAENFKSIKIYKSNNWKCDSRIMFISIPEKFIMRIYDSHGEHIDGYSFTDYLELMEIKKVMSITLKSM